MQASCDGVLDFSSFTGRVWDSELKCSVGEAKCPKCGEVKRLCIRWHGSIPPGGVRCGIEVETENEETEETNHES